MNDPILSISKLERYFYQGDKKINILMNAELNLYPGKLTALIGPSGAGKTTLLNIAGLLEKPNSGNVKICNQDTFKLSEKERTLIRRKHIGFVFQSHRLFQEFSAIENIIIPQMLSGLEYVEAKKRALQLLEMIGLSNRKSHRPGSLSGGEQQRVAIARALINNPELIIADEMTGNLDEKTADTVFEFFLDKISSNNQTLIYVTHNEKYAKKANTAFEISNNQIHKI